MLFTVISAGSVLLVAENLTASHANRPPANAEPSPSEGLLTGGGTGGGTHDSEGETDTGSGPGAENDGVPLLSADNLGAFGSVIGGVAGAMAVCVSVYQFRVSRSAAGEAALAAEPPPIEPPPSEGYL
ncbi:hypothetical protein [Streptomyces sp. WMMB 322]|uniref:hypothetical protein n=1 Tax=Streptomyces sp. WMMB 322 TaxID=1286821 RepID=UPI00111317AB|nr:hypothetical protein [Streptomyces sp. WMMB 322]